MDSKRITNDSDETKKLGEEVAQELKAGDALLLFGDLGAGKTTFVQGLAKGLGVTERILSPTFVLQRIHKVLGRDFKTLNHIDLYRLEGKHDIHILGLSETIEDSESITIIEWADRLIDFLPKQGYKIWFEYLEENGRKIKIEKI